MSISKEERDARVQKALDEAACQHPAAARSVDLATADEYCGDCGAVTDPYRKGMFGRLPGDDAAEVIAVWLRKQGTHRAGKVIVQHVQHTGGNLFDVAARVYTPEAGQEFVNFVLVQVGGLVAVSSARH